MKGYVKVSTEDIKKAVDNWDNAYYASKEVFRVFRSEMKAVPVRKWWGCRSNKWVEVYGNPYKVYEDCPKAYMFLEIPYFMANSECTYLQHSEEGFAYLDSELARFVSLWKDIDHEDAMRGEY